MSRTNRKYWSDGNWREARKGGQRLREMSREEHASILWKTNKREDFRARLRDRATEADIRAWDAAEAPDPFYVDDYTRGTEDFIMDDYYGRTAESDAYHEGYFRDFTVRAYDW